MERTLVLIGGGEIRSKETLEIDRKIAAMAQKHAGEKRPVALFIGTASHDFMPYYNTFHKTYTGELGLKTDVALTVFHEPDREKIHNKFLAADMIYVGGGDTVFMLESWTKSGLLDEIKDAYARGVVLSGLSAGAICWGKTMFTDSSVTADTAYHMEKGLGLLPFGVCPHYNVRREEFAAALTSSGEWLCLENNSAAVFEDETLCGALTSGGKCCFAEKTEEGIKEKEIALL